jgi:hypothetical protein
MSDTWDAFPEASKFAPGPATTIPGGGGAPTQVILNTDTGKPVSAPPDNWDAYPEANPVTAGGLAKSAGVGVAEGLIGIPGMAGDVQQLANRGMDYLLEKNPPSSDHEKQ